MATINITGNCEGCKYLRVCLDDVQKISVAGTDTKGITINKPPGTYHISWTAESNSSKDSIEVYLELIPNCEVTWKPKTPSWQESFPEKSRVYGLPKSQQVFKRAGEKISGKVEFTF